jgi:hypothetical protein
LVINQDTINILARRNLDDDEIIKSMLICCENFDAILLVKCSDAKTLFAKASG